MALARIDHFGVVVEDIELAEDWYTRVLGFQTAWTEAPTDVPGGAVALPDVEHVRLCGRVLQLGDTFMELHQYFAPPGEDGTLRRTCDLGIGHYALFADDMWAEYRRLQNPGGDLPGVEWYGEPYEIRAGGLTGHWSVYGRDPLGVVIQLCWHPPSPNDAEASG